MRGFALLIILAAAGAANAQTVYRCGSTFSNLPCAVRADASESRPMLGDNESVPEFALRQARYLEESRGRGNPRQQASTSSTPSANSRSR